MTDSQATHNSSLLTRFDQPLIGVLVEEDGKEMIRYYFEELEQESVSSESITQDAIHLAGAWSDLDWRNLEQELDRIRHETPPSPPLAL